MPCFIRCCHHINLTYARTISHLTSYNPHELLQLPHLNTLQRHPPAFRFTVNYKVLISLSQTPSTPVTRKYIFTFLLHTFQTLEAPLLQLRINSSDILLPTLTCCFYLSIQPHCFCSYKAQIQLRLLSLILLLQHFHHEQCIHRTQHETTLHVSHCS